jgi:phage terminase large subunit
MSGPINLYKSINNVTKFLNELQYTDSSNTIQSTEINSETNNVTVNFHSEVSQEIRDRITQFIQQYNDTVSLLSEYTHVNQLRAQSEITSTIFSYYYLWRFNGRDVEDLFCGFSVNAFVDKPNTPYTIRVFDKTNFQILALEEFTNTIPLFNNIIINHALLPIYTYADLEIQVKVSDSSAKVTLRGLSLLNKKW